MNPLEWFREIWCVDFEFGTPDGELPEVRCMVAREVRTGRLVRLWLDGADQSACPIPTDKRSLFVAYFASAELNCFRVLGWPHPAAILDLYVEFRRITNGRTLQHGRGLLGAMAYFGLPCLKVAEKTHWQNVAIRGGPYTDDEALGLLDYCQEDVDAIRQLLPHFEPHLVGRRLSQALFRGRYMSAVSAMESTGTPVDVELLNELREHWDRMITHVIRSVDSKYRVFVPVRVGNTPTSSKRGKTILVAAQWFGVDPHLLALAVEEIERERRERAAAVSAARKRTGLTVNRIERWEESGQDYSSYPGLDVAARELAGQHRELGLGVGYSQTEYDTTDHAALLWDQLREPAKRIDLLAAIDLAAERVPPLEDENWIADDVPLTFNSARFADWLIRNDIPWPRTESGDLDLTEDTFRQQAKSHHAVSALRELRAALGSMRLFKDLTVGEDGRNRCMLSPFASRSSRNQPSNAKYIFGPHVWVRGLIKPAPGRAVAYIDWSQQEIAIAAVLSGDRNMMDAYTSGDFYMTFAIQCGAAPAGATKQTHRDVRELYKQTCLATNYGQGEYGLAEKLNKPLLLARRLLRDHRETYRDFWDWAERVVDAAMLGGSIETVYGWPVFVDDTDVNPRSLRNHPCQGGGAEMMRLAACLLVERGIEVCAPVHDAFLIEAAAGDIDDAVHLARETMEEASRVVLDGFTVRTDAEIVRHPNRYMDPRGQEMWDQTMTVLDTIRSDETADEWSDCPF